MGKLGVVLEMIKFEHTIFALPFAFMGAFMAARGLPSGRVAFWVLVAMAGARSAAMAFNRLVDARVDAANPRTAERAIPKGLISRSFVLWFILGASILFFFAAWQLNDTCLLLSPMALAVVLLYSYTKRISCASHLVLGAALGLAPIGGWLAQGGPISAPPLLLGGGVVLWVAGFDIIYSLMDMDFDRRTGLHSVPARLGAAGALRVSELLHLLSAALFLWAGVTAGLGPAYFLGMAVVSVFLIVQHLAISPTDLSRLNMSFFTLNGAVSVVLFLATVMSLG